MLIFCYFLWIQNYIVMLSGSCNPARPPQSVLLRARKQSSLSLRSLFEGEFFSSKAWSWVMSISL